MWWALRQAIAIGVLPAMVVVIVPIWIGRAVAVSLTIPTSSVEWAMGILGLGLMVVGGMLFIGCLWRFGTTGRGTLAPWDPPTNLVVAGPYAHVRNPMITGVILLLLAEAALLMSPAHVAWAGLFFLINAVYIPLLEEPQLRRRFGEAYEEYARNVPRLIPRLRPWIGPGRTAYPPSGVVDSATPESSTQ